MLAGTGWLLRVEDVSSQGSGAFVRWPRRPRSDRRLSGPLRPLETAQRLLWSQLGSSPTGVSRLPGSPGSQISSESLLLHSHQMQKPRNQQLVWFRGFRGAFPTYRKFAVTDLLASMVKVQVTEVPAHAPPQPTQGCPAPGVAVSVTTVPLAKLCVAGSVVTVPLPFLLMLILNEAAPPPPPPPAAIKSKFAVTLFSPLMVKVQVKSAPTQSPVHPVKVELLDGFAVRVTTVPSASGVEQVPPQFILPPPTVPDPVPVRITVTEDTPTLAAAIWWPMKSPNSPASGVVHKVSPPQIALWLSGS